MRTKNILLVSLLAVLGLVFQSCDDKNDEKNIQFADLPSVSKTLVNTHFADKKVASVMKDNEFMDKSYTVFFTDGTKVEFEKNGEWDSVESPEGVPSSIIPSKIRAYVTENYPDEKVITIERDQSDKEIEVELSNRFDLIFDATTHELKKMD
ncbi:MAG TPA: hypothetical protein DDW85_08800 [Porphyromonadaceae bacterium]|nr:hypothetical protein [Porphyromonadaceae bacterium]